MKELTPPHIQENWGKLIQLINDNFSGERLEKLLKMYDYFEERMCLAPASGKEHFHNAHAGGYVEHVLHITDLVVQIYDLWGKNGATIDNFDKEELIFAALHHDLGKVGDLSEDYYTPNDSDWHRKNQGLIYKHNGKLQYMTVTDRAIWLLQHFGIQMTENEYLGLRLTDGLYEEANKGYLMSYSDDFQLKTNLPIILHQGDMMASRLEYEEWKFGYVGSKEHKVTKGEAVELSDNQKDVFKELFGGSK